LFKDLASGYLHAIITVFIEAFKEVLSFYARHEATKTKILRTDSESIFLSSETTAFLTSQLIQLETSAPERHFQVSVERDMQSVFKSISTTLHSQMFLRLDMWPLALLEFIEKKIEPQTKDATHYHHIRPSPAIRPIY
jgi:hypothetical protein